MYVSVGKSLGDEPSPAILYVHKQRLVWGDPSEKEVIDEKVDLPAGFFRPVAVLVMGSPDGVRDAWAPLGGLEPARLDDAYAAVALWPLHRGSIHWLRPDTYTLEFEVVGSNFDAVVYRGRVAIGSEKFNDEQTVQLTYRWIDTPTRAQRTISVGQGRPV